MKKYPKILISPGDPSGIGYDILFDLTKKKFPAHIVIVASYDKLKERSKYITDEDMIAHIDKIEFFVKELRKHIVRTDI